MLGVSAEASKALALLAQIDRGDWQKNSFQWTAYWHPAKRGLGGSVNPERTPLRIA
jgi:hypothetical protein